jgi:hypothetical protein
MSPPPPPAPPLPPAKGIQERLSPSQGESRGYCRQRVPDLKVKDQEFMKCFYVRHAEAYRRRGVIRKQHGLM